MTETLIHKQVFIDHHQLLGTISRNQGLDKFIFTEGRRMQEEDPILTEGVAFSYQYGPVILGNFSSVLYALGATLAHKLIRDSQRFTESPTPSVSQENIYYYTRQMIDIVDHKGSQGFVEWIQEQAHTLVPELAYFFEGTINSNLPPEMYWGMVEAAYPFAIEAGIIT